MGVGLLSLPEQCLSSATIVMSFLSFPDIFCGHGLLGGVLRLAMGLMLSTEEGMTKRLPGDRSTLLRFFVFFLSSHMHIPGHHIKPRRLPVHIFKFAIS
jgi:hypothetical protein